MEYSIDERALGREVDVFDAYASGFMDGGADRATLELKRAHCLRVLHEARGITAALSADDGLTPELERAVHAAALFHDVGRFEQFSRWKTFDDRRSRDHGRLGLAVLKQQGWLARPEADLSAPMRKVVYAAVSLHNKRFVPTGLAQDAALALRVVRDADKLDIFPVMLKHLAPHGTKNDVVTLHLADDPLAYTPSILEQVSSRTLADYARMRTLNDFKLLLLSWIYDLNFAVSRRAVVQRGYLDRLLEYLPQAPRFEALGRQLRADSAV